MQRVPSPITESQTQSLGAIDEALASMQNEIGRAETAYLRSFEKDNKQKQQRYNQTPFTFDPAGYL